MRELALLLLVLGALSAGRASHAEEGCRAMDDDSGVVAVCGDTRELDSASLEDPAPRPAPSRVPAAPAGLPGDGLASGSKPIGPADRENVPRGRSY